MYLERHALTYPAPYDVSLVWVINGYEHIGWLDISRTRVIGEGYNVPITNTTYWLEKIINND